MEKLTFCLCSVLIGSLVEVSHALLNITIPAKLNRDISLPCRLPPDASSDINVRWFNGKDGWLTSGTRVYKHIGQISVDKPAPNEWNLRIRRISKSFEDIFKCKTEQGTLISVVELVIETAPKIDDQQSTPIRIAFDEDSTAILKCVVTGTPTPLITWYRIQDGDKKELGISGPELKIRGVKRYAAGEYMCDAYNKNGNDDRIMKVTVEFAPEVNVMEPEVYAAGGEVVVMSCVVQASPLIDAYWTFGTDVNGKRINANWKYLVMTEEAGDDVPVRFLTLIIRKSILAHKDYGTYTCVAKSKDAVAKDTVKLKLPVTVNTEDKKEDIINYN